MAQVLPFAAWRYDREKVRLEDVLTQPYDKITPAMQSEYYEKSPYNLIRLELGRKSAEDTETNNAYTRAADFLVMCRREGALVQDKEPALYAYSQTFAAPSDAGKMMTRRGFIALGKLHDYADGVVFRHEQTLSKPKADRLSLLRSTRAHTGQIFMLYGDPERKIDSLLWGATNPSRADAEMKDDYGVTNRLWKVTEPGTVASVRNHMEDKKLIIADGHHRYETALAYRNERRAQEGMDWGQTAANIRAPYEKLMMTFVNMEDEGLLILPTHRVVFGVMGFTPEKLLSGAAKYFDVAPLGASASCQVAATKLREAGEEGTALAVKTAAGVHVLRAKHAAIKDGLRSVPFLQSKLDVVQLHRLLLEEVLGIPEEAIREQKNLEYLRSAEEAFARVDSGADAAFLMNPVPIQQMRDVALAGEVMPQKSTDFYPKLMSGLTIYAVE